MASGTINECYDDKCAVSVKDSNSGSTDYGSH